MTLCLICANCFKSVHNIEVFFYPSACFLSEAAERILVRTKFTQIDRGFLYCQYICLLAVIFESI